MIEWIQAHPLTAFSVYWVLSNVISHLPTPLPEERWYKCIFGTLQGVFGNSGRIAATLFPQIAKFLPPGPDDKGKGASA